MTKLEKVRDILHDYKKEADKQFKQFAEEERRARARYSDDTFKFEMKTRIFPTAAGTLRGDANIAIMQINSVLDDVESEFNEWVMKPLDYSTTQILEYINKFNLSLSLSELKAIEDKIVGSYFGMKIFKKIAEASGYVILGVPTMQECMDAFERARKETEFAVKAYAGEPPFPGTELVEDWVVNGAVNYGRYTEKHHIIALNKLRDTGDINDLEEILKMIKAPIEYELSPGEKKEISQKIKKIMDNGEVDQEVATKLVEEDSNFASKLESFLKEEDGHGYGIAEENKGTLEKYFRIGIYQPSSFEIARVRKPEDSPNRGKVNEEILSQYK